MHRKTLIIILSVIAAVAVIAVLGVFAMSRAPKPAQTASPHKPIKAFGFTLKDINGKTHSLSDYRGKMILLNFWATWCHPCRQEMPSMQKMYENCDRERFEILAVNAKEDAVTVRAFAKKNGYTFPILLDPDYKISGMYRVSAIPITYLIDKDRNIIGRVCGAQEWKWDQIKPLLK